MNNIWQIIKYITKINNNNSGPERRAYMKNSMNPNPQRFKKCYKTTTNNVKEGPIYLIQEPNNYAIQSSILLASSL